MARLGDNTQRVEFLNQLRAKAANSGLKICKGKLHEKKNRRNEILSERKSTLQAEEYDIGIYAKKLRDLKKKIEAANKHLEQLRKQNAELEITKVQEDEVVKK